MKNENKRFLVPADGRKSFYGKAYTIDDGGAEVLYSYDTPIMRRDRSGALVRLWPARSDDFTATTGQHIIAFCGLNKAAFLALPLA